MSQVVFTGMSATTSALPERTSSMSRHKCHNSSPHTTDTFDTSDTRHGHASPHTRLCTEPGISVVFDGSASRWYSSRHIRVRRYYEKRITGMVCAGGAAVKRCDNGG